MIKIPLRQIISIIMTLEKLGASPSNYDNFPPSDPKREAYDLKNNLLKLIEEMESEK